MSVVSEATGASHTLDYAGRTYTARPLDLDAEDALEEYLFAREKKALAATRDLMDADKYAARLRELNAEFVDGDYSLISERGRRFIAKPAGMLVLAGILFGIDKAQMRTLFLAKQAEVTALIELILEESLPGVREAKAKGRAEAEGQSAESPKN